MSSNLRYESTGNIFIQLTCCHCGKIPEILYASSCGHIYCDHCLQLLLSCSECNHIFTVPKTCIRLYLDQFVADRCGHLETAVRCPICLDELTDARMARCGHVYCDPCIRNWIKYNPDSCPICRERLGQFPIKLFVGKITPNRDMQSDFELVPNDILNRTVNRNNLIPVSIIALLVVLYGISYYIPEVVPCFILLMIGVCLYDRFFN